MFHAMLTTLRKMRPDFIILVCDGNEVGCGEIKPPTATANELKEDRCRIPEHMKRQLPRRLQSASDEKKLVTFGFFVFGQELELSMLEFKGGNTSTQWSKS